MIAAIKSIANISPAYAASVLVGINLMSPNKQAGENRYAKTRRIKTQRAAVHWALKAIPKPFFPCVVTMTRIAPSNGLDGHDNLRGSAKAAVDGVADWLGIRDDDKRVEWRYDQERGEQYQVRITVQGDV